jgi:hypothetical protein
MKFARGNLIQKFPSHSKTHILRGKGVLAGDRTHNKLLLMN